MCDWCDVVDFEVCWWCWGSAVLAGVVVAVEDVFACVGGDVFGVGPHGGVGCPCVGWGLGVWGGVLVGLGLLLSHVCVLVLVCECLHVSDMCECLKLCFFCFFVSLWMCEDLNLMDQRMCSPI